MFFGVSRSVTECFQSVTDYLQPVTELGTPKNMAVALPGMTLQPLYLCIYSGVIHAIPLLIYNEPFLTVRYLWLYWPFSWGRITVFTTEPGADKDNMTANS